MERVKTLIVKTPSGDVENTYEVSYPTIGQVLSIESMKLSVSNNKYTEMILSGTAWMSRALNYTDLISYFSVLCPKLLKDMKVDLRTLDVLDVHEGLLKVYLEQFLPWWNDYETLVTKLERGVEEDSTEDSDKEDGQEGAE